MQILFIKVYNMTKKEYTSIRVSRETLDELKNLHVIYNWLPIESITQKINAFILMYKNNEIK